MSDDSHQRPQPVLSGVSRIPWPRAGRGVWKRSYETQWSGVAPNIQLPVVLLQEFAVENNTLMSPVLAQVESRLSVSRKTVKLVLENQNREQVCVTRAEISGSSFSSRERAVFKL